VAAETMVVEALVAVVLTVAVRVEVM